MSRHPSGDFLLLLQTGILENTLTKWCFYLLRDWEVHVCIFLCREVLILLCGSVVLLSCYLIYLKREQMRWMKITLLSGCSSSRTYQRHFQRCLKILCNVNFIFLYNGSSSPCNTSQNCSNLKPFHQFLSSVSTVSPVNLWCTSGNLWAGSCVKHPSSSKRSWAVSCLYIIMIYRNQPAGVESLFSPCLVLHSHLLSWNPTVLHSIISGVPYLSCLQAKEVSNRKWIYACPREICSAILFNQT